MGYNWQEKFSHLIGVVGNKCELYLSEVISEEEGKKYADIIWTKYIFIY